MIYGSYAKGESNENSDIDVLLITEESKPFERDLITLVDKSIDLNRVDLKIMSYSYFYKLVLINSLFIHHLKECGIFLKGEDRFISDTRNVGKYIITKNETKKLIILAKDCLKSISKSGVNLFDLNILFTFFRNAIILLNYKKGKLEFNKIKLLQIYEFQYKDSVNINKIYFLCNRAKLKYNRNIDNGELLYEWNNSMRNTIIKFIKYFSKEINYEN